MAVVYLGLGSNLGDRRSYLARAIAFLTERVGKRLALSAFRETAPWGFHSAHPFLNAVIEMETALDPYALLREMRAIERELGRVGKSEGTYHDRVIDIDILFYEDQVIELPDLVVPHPLMTERLFVLEPLAEIAPGMRHPVRGKTVEALLQDLKARTNESF